MRTILLIFGLFFSLNLMAQKVDPKELYNAIADNDLVGLKLILKAAPVDVDMDPVDAKMALNYIKAYWCNKASVDKELIIKVTALLVPKLSEDTKVALMNEILNWNRSNGSQNLLEMGKVLASNMNVTALWKRMHELLTLELVTKTQMLSGLEALINEAQGSSNRAQANATLTRVANLSSLYLTEKECAEITAKVKGAVDKQEQKDRDIVTARIADYLGSNDGYAAAMLNMSKYLLGIKVKVEGVNNEDLLSKIILGTPERNFNDAFLNQFKTMNGKVCSVIAFLFFVSNEQVMYEGAMCDMSVILENIFVESSYFKPSILNEAYNAAGSIAYIQVLDKEFLMKDILPKNGFKTLEVLEKGYLTK